MRRALILTVGLVLAGCGDDSGVISAEDRKSADAFWESRSDFEADALCEQLNGSAADRLAAVEAVKGQLIEANNELAGDDPQKWLEGLDSETGVGPRAEAIIQYLHDEKC